MRLRFLIPAIMIVVGIICIIGGAVGYHVTPLILKNQLRDALIVSSSSSTGYAAFTDSRHGEDGGGGLYVSYTIFNFTNPVDLHKGTGLPRFSAVGPFVYIKRTQKSEVTFLNGGVQVRYKGQISYTFVPEKSGVSVDTTANLLVVNPYYIAAQEKAGSELNLNMTMASLQFSILQDIILRDNTGFTVASRCISLYPGVTPMSICTFFDYQQKFGSGTRFNLEDGNKILSTFANTATLIQYYNAWMKSKSADADFDLPLRAIFINWAIPFTQAAADELALYLTYFIEQIVASGGAVAGTDLGIFLKRTSARSLLFDEDQASKIIFGQSGNRLITDQKDMRVTSSYTAYTGEGNDQDINGQRFSEYAGVSIIDNYPKKDIMNYRVRSIAAFQNPSSNTANIYYDLVKRTIPIQKYVSTTVDGLPVQVYKINTTSLVEVNLDYNNTIRGFFSLASVMDKKPLLISAPYYIDVDDKYTSMVYGMQLPKDYNPLSTITIEPVTGFSIEYTLKMQLNLRIDFGKMTYTGIKNPLFSSELMYPMLLIQDTVATSKKDVAFLKKATGNPQDTAYIVLIVFLVIGFFLLIVGLIILLCHSCCLDVDDKWNNQFMQTISNFGVRQECEALQIPGAPPKKVKGTFKEFYDIEDQISRFKTTPQNDNNLFPTGKKGNRPIPRINTINNGGIVSIVSKKNKTMSISEMDIQIVMTNANVKRSEAIEALKATEGDVINAILFITENDEMEVFSVVMNTAHPQTKAVAEEPLKMDYTDDRDTRITQTTQSKRVTESAVVSIITKTNKKICILESDIDIVMRHAEVARSEALEGLRESEGEVINAIHEIMKNRKFNDLAFSLKK